MHHGYNFFFFQNQTSQNNLHPAAEPDEKENRPIHRMHNKMTRDPTVANRYGFVNKTLKSDIHDEVYNVVPSAAGRGGGGGRGAQGNISIHTIRLFVWNNHKTISKKKNKKIDALISKHVITEASIMRPVNEWMLMYDIFACAAPRPARGRH